MKKRIISIITLFFWLTSLIFNTIPHASAQEWQDLDIADIDGDGLLTDMETAGWSNKAGFFQTDPLDADSDDDGLTDGEEKLYDTDPNDPQIPGIYVKYQDPFKTKEYFHATDPAYISVTARNGT